MNVINPEIVSESVDSNRAEFELRVPRKLIYLQGHFPAEPVLPGVVQVHWAIQFASERLGINPAFTGMEALKFHRVIEPDTLLKLTIEIAEETGKLYFTYASAAGVHSQGRVLFE
jgi:3-hydroxymyristoyl/3-hydroxydecanoyl-(acyl carrier protein) dehydratase